MKTAIVTTDTLDLNGDSFQIEVCDNEVTVWETDGTRNSKVVLMLDTASADQLAAKIRTLIAEHARVTVLAKGGVA